MVGAQKHMPPFHVAMNRAVREIMATLRSKPYRRYKTKITKWQAIVEQMLDGRRSGEFSWMRSLMEQVRTYIHATFCFG